MDFQYTPEQDAFRLRVRSWLAEHLPSELKVEDAMDERVAPNREIFDKRMAWHKQLYQAGWIGLAWPKEYGGQGAELMEQIIYNEEYAHARAPILPGYVGLGLAGPTIAQWGSEEQKQYFLPRILQGELVWCQGYSEPGSGSDLASLQTRAVEDGDEFVVNGQKVWTSGAQYADWMVLLAPDRPRGAQTQGHQLFSAGHENPGGERPAAGAAERPQPLQRGVFRGRADSQGQPAGTQKRGLEGRHHHPDV